MVTSLPIYSHSDDFLGIQKCKSDDAHTVLYPNRTLFYYSIVLLSFTHMFTFLNLNIEGIIIKQHKNIYFWLVDRLTAGSEEYIFFKKIIKIIIDFFRKNNKYNSIKNKLIITATTSTLL